MGSVLEKVPAVNSLPPLRPRNGELRPREWLSPEEVEALLVAAGGTRCWVRDPALVLVMYRHGLRVGELVRLRWSQVELDAQRLHVKRLKGSISGPHPLWAREVEALRALAAYRRTPYVFERCRGPTGPLTTGLVRRLIRRLGVRAELPFPVHPHMLRHATGYWLANQGWPTRDIQAFLGHANMNHTARYTAIQTERFVGFWPD